MITFSLFSCLITAQCNKPNLSPAVFLMHIYLDFKKISILIEAVNQKYYFPWMSWSAINLTIILSVSHLSCDLYFEKSKQDFKQIYREKTNANIHLIRATSENMTHRNATAKIRMWIRWGPNRRRKIVTVSHFILSIVQEGSAVVHVRCQKVNAEIEDVGCRPS